MYRHTHTCTYLAVHTPFSRLYVDPSERRVQRHVTEALQVECVLHVWEDLRGAPMSLTNPMGFHGISWDFRGFYGIAWDFMGFHGIPWDFMEFYGISWDFMGFQGISV